MNSPSTLLNLPAPSTLPPLGWLPRDKDVVVYEITPSGAEFTGSLTTILQRLAALGRDIFKDRIALIRGDILTSALGHQFHMSPKSIFEFEHGRAVDSVPYEYINRIASYRSRKARQDERNEREFIATGGEQREEGGGQ